MNKLSTLIALVLAASAGAAYANGEDVTYPANVGTTAVKAVQLGGPVDYSIYAEGNATRQAPVTVARTAQAKPYDAVMAAADLKMLYID